MQEREYALGYVVGLLSNNPQAYFVVNKDNTKVFVSDRCEETFAVNWLGKKLVNFRMSHKQGVAIYNSDDKLTYLKFPTLYAKNGLLGIQNEKGSWEVSEFSRIQKFFTRCEEIPDGYSRFKMVLGVDDLVYKLNPTIRTFKYDSEMIEFISTY